MSSCKKTIFLDRDGVINIDKSYVHKWEDFEFVPFAVKAMKDLVDAGYQIVVVTNQSGIARGFYTERQYWELTDKIRKYLYAQGVPLLDILHCPHHPGGSIPEYAIQCTCRKPKPGLLLDASRKYNIDLSYSVLVGDKSSDIDAAKTGGIRFSYLIKPHGLEKSGSDIDICSVNNTDGVFKNLHDFAQWLLVSDPLCEDS